MTFDAALFNPTQLHFELDPAVQTQAWQQSQAFATPTSRWNAYLNQLCLQTLLPWLREDAPQMHPVPSSDALHPVWELVNGAVVGWAQRRMVLIPTETIDLDEIRVPQEWVDIPDWVADYYLMVQVHPDQGWVRVAGFVTHQRLKQLAQFDLTDRSYSLTETDLIPDLSVLWLAEQLSLEATRAPVTDLPPLSAPEAASLLQRLGNPDLLHPRLAVPFERWGALLSHSGWRRQLAERRRGLPEQRSLRQWLQAGVPAWAQQMGWGRVDYQLGTAAARGSGEANPTSVLSRLVTIAAQRYELQVMPVDFAANIWRFELINLAPAGQIPQGVTLRLLTEDLQPFTDNEDTATAAVERLYIEVALEPDEGLVWEIEPTPEAYEPEILRF